jgi:hypothetical protein
MAMKNLDNREKNKIPLLYGSQQRIKFIPTKTGKFGSLNLIEGEVNEMSSNAYNMLVEYYPHVIGKIISINGKAMEGALSNKFKEELKKEILEEMNSEKNSSVKEKSDDEESALPEKNVRMRKK